MPTNKAKARAVNDWESSSQSREWGSESGMGGVASEGIMN